MNLINLTPHALTIRAEGGRMVTIPPTAPAARREQWETQVSQEAVADNIFCRVTRQKFGPVLNLPAEETGITLIVSRLVAEACPERHDLLIPGPLLRDEQGRVVGCNGLSVL